MTRWSRAATLAAAAGASLCAASQAQAADCNFAGKNTVYVTGSSASQPVLAAISGVLAAQSPAVNLVYVKTESCQGVQTFVSNTALPAAATYWTTTNGVTTATSCSLPSPAPLADASASDVLASTCPNITLGASLQEVQGPVQAMTFSVHPNSTEQSMSAEAARVIMKDIATTYQVAPWTTAANVFIRPGGATGSGTRAMIGKAVGLADADWAAPLQVKTGSGDVLAALAGDSANANASLGILSVTVTDANRPGSASATPVKELAFQAKGQQCGYLPDSSSTSFDKLNVREGRYGIWGAIHFITAVDANRKPVSTSLPGTNDAFVQSFINAVTLPTGTTLTSAQKKAVIDATVTGHVVPQCAMRVRRDAEVGPEASYQPDEPCGCYWESKATGAVPTGCVACTADGTTDAACTGSNKTCRYGFCEAK